MKRWRCVRYRDKALIAVVAAVIGSGDAVSTESCTSGAQGPEASGRRGSGALTIVVKGNNWGEGKPENIQVLLDNVASHFTRHLREGLFETIEIWNSSKGPMILWRLPGRTKYAILLDTIGTRWAQYSYQFAHEFCHLLSGYDRLKGSANSWFHESVCEAASFFVLRSMGVTWRDAPPYPNWRSYAQHLTSYAQLQASKVEPGLPVGSPPGVWLRAHEAQGRRDPTRRDEPTASLRSECCRSSNMIRRAGTQSETSRHRTRRSSNTWRNGRSRHTRAIENL